MIFAIEIVKPSIEVVSPHPDDWPKLLEIVELCGRVSHKSEGRIKPGSAAKFVRKVAVKLGHESILEHATITARLIGSRAMSHQLVRHRLAAYTQESMRFCDYSRGGTPTLQVICPETIWPLEERPAGDAVITEVDGGTGPADEFCRQCLVAYGGYLKMREGDVPAEDARFLLPTATKTEVYTTFNLRMWLHFFAMRCDPHAQWEIRSLACQMRNLFAEHIPSVLPEAP